MSLWRYLEGAKPPPAKKRKQSDNERKAAARDYDREKRVRKFNPQWKFDDQGKPRDWLQHNKEANVMFCSVCKEHCHKEVLRKGLFVKGTDNFKLESIRKHAASQAHKQSCMTATAKATSSRSSVAGKALASLNQAQTKRMEILFRSAHAIAKNGMSFHRF